MPEIASRVRIRPREAPLADPKRKARASPGAMDRKSRLSRFKVSHRSAANARKTPESDGTLSL